MVLNLVRAPAAATAFRPGGTGPNVPVGSALAPSGRRR